MHITKDYDVRLNEFLDAAQRLFMEKGYENTPISVIIDAVGVSKGAFYHYFSSKEELLDAISERTAQAGRGIMDAIADDPVLTAREKLNRVFASSLAFKARNRGVILTLLKVMYDDRNLRLRKRMEKRGLEVNAPIIARILAQGKTEGTFDLDDPAESATLILRLGSAMVERIAEESIAVASRADSAPAVRPGSSTNAYETAATTIPEPAVARVRSAMRSYRDAITRILGAAPGSVVFEEDDVISILISREEA
jgi:AcrR family transcriptional regulator